MENGFRLSYLADKEQSLSVRVYNVGHERCKSGHSWGPGMRDFYLLHHVLSGKGYYIANGTQYVITAGNTFIIYPETIVTYYADEKDPWEYYWVGFRGNDASFIMNITCFSKNNIVVDHIAGNELKELLSKIYESKGKDDVSKIKMSGYLLLALSLFIQKNESFGNNPSVQYCKKAAEYIAYNYSQYLTISEISNYIGLSRSQLYRVFLQNFNKSPIQYLTEYRIEQSLHLLKDPSITIEAVGNSVGFDDSLYFSRVFKKINGVSPSIYRKRLQGNNHE